MRYSAADSIVGTWQVAQTGPAWVAGLWGQGITEQGAYNCVCVYAQGKITGGLFGVLPMFQGLVTRG
jgi:hypothetical protein